MSFVRDTIAEDIMKDAEDKALWNKCYDVRRFMIILCTLMNSMAKKICIPYTNYYI
ncbi:hypothetical protein JHK85_009581 [Glycine max]|uniref:Uncharacterized protein n=1 Tax=Glycine soja TaxID=3848 RepID=A0A445KXQ4_GLYSO|nr:hypothetical protein JHK87_009186 [Glycine soja]KAG5048478.1 hypothetical protein JHK85_009581 [Glycine max]KAG5065592.1 hypothetical protein JHK86_009323 [Glycine max]KAH1110247.1 hypothetical protein GYH30_009222 [Glycine max]RZC15486.1 hypothetical protein D0Y65_009041 [Glycine soja]